MEAERYENQGDHVTDDTHSHDVSYDTTDADQTEEDTHSAIVRRRKTKSPANLQPLPSLAVPDSSTNDATGGQGKDDTQASHVPRPRRRKENPFIHLKGDVKTICAVLHRMQADRVMTLRQVTRGVNGTRARLRTIMGWRMDLTEEEKERIAKSAGRITDAVVWGKLTSKESESIGQDAFSASSVIVGRSSLSDEEKVIAKENFAMLFMERKSTAPREKYMSEIEAKMRSIAELLPASVWIKCVHGAGLLGLAIVVGEAGSPLSEFSNPGKLWKRLGLAPHWCYKMTTKDGKEVEAIPRRRRSAIWTVADALLNKGKKNIYADLYQQRLVFECQKNPEFLTGNLSEKTGKPCVLKHGRRRASRYAEKRFIRDLWREWRKLDR